MTHELEEYHIPVLLEKSIDLLVTNSSGVYVDGTLGGGGHSARILRKLDDIGRVFGFDQDASAVEYAKKRFANEKRITVVPTNVVYLRSVLQEHHINRIEGILLDLGMSSKQIDTPERGFSFQYNGPLDMRMDLKAGYTAAHLIQQSSVSKLIRIFSEYGEERYSKKIAHAIVRSREQKPIETTSDLTRIVKTCIPSLHVNKSLARIFQALRIAVNNELVVLERTIKDAFEMLTVSGRMVVISYHSLEDRIVKTFFKSEALSCICPPQIPVCVCGKEQRMKILTPKSIQPDENEIRRNPRARSARLRAGEKIHA